MGGSLTRAATYASTQAMMDVNAEAHFATEQINLSHNMFVSGQNNAAGVTAAIAVNQYNVLQRRNGIAGNAFQGLAQILTTAAYALVPAGAVLYGVCFVTRSLTQSAMFAILIFVILSGYYFILSTLVYYNTFLQNPKYFGIGVFISLISSAILSFAIYPGPIQQKNPSSKSPLEKLNLKKENITNSTFRECFTTDLVNDDLGSYLLNYFILYSDSLDSNTIFCNPKYNNNTFEEHEKLQLLFNIKKHNINDCSKCINRTNYFNSVNKSSISVPLTLVSKYLEKLKRLYNPPTKFPNLLTEDKLNLVVYYKGNKDNQNVQPTSQLVQKAAKTLKTEIKTNKGVAIHVFVEEKNLIEEDKQKIKKLDEIGAKIYYDNKINLIDFFDAMVRSDALIIPPNCNLSLAAGIIHQNGIVWLTTTTNKIIIHDLALLFVKNKLD